MGSSNLLSAGGNGRRRRSVPDESHPETKVSLGVETDIQSLTLSMSKRNSVFKGGSFMWRITRRAFSISALTLLLLSFAPSAVAAVITHAGTLPDGATFLIEVPSPWNGTLLLYSHGYVSPGSPNGAQDVGDPATRAFLLANGFALAGSSYAHTGLAIQEALPEPIAVLDPFASLPR